jgi:hypothetical protein
MFVCMYVCMHICMYVCLRIFETLYVCVDSVCRSLGGDSGVHLGDSGAGALVAIIPTYTVHTYIPCVAPRLIFFSVNYTFSTYHSIAFTHTNTIHFLSPL